MGRKKLYTLRGSLQQYLKEQKKTRKKKAIKALLRGYVCGQEQGPAGRSQCVEGAGGGKIQQLAARAAAAVVMGRDEDLQVEPALSVLNNPTNQVSWRRLHLVNKTTSWWADAHDCDWCCLSGDLTSASCTDVPAVQVLHKLSWTPLLSTRPHVLGYYFLVGPWRADLRTLDIFWLRREVCDLVTNN